jgi:hypothetical protein
MLCDVVRQLTQRQARKIQLGLWFVCQQQFRGNLLLDSGCEIRRALQIEWYCDSAAQQATVKSCDPLGTVLAPEEHTVAFA